jgi:beta-RFAP synthase
MIDSPGLQMDFEPAPRWSCTGMLADRAMRELTALLECHGGALGELQPHAVNIVRAPPEHVGLGTGTQLCLALASGLLELSASTSVDLFMLARRGRRSAIGCHGFKVGGFLVDGGKHARSASSSIAPLISRLEFPGEWRIVLVTPRSVAGRHGDTEQQVFDCIGPVSTAFRQGQCARLLLELLPALAEADFSGFSEALYQFNRTAGEPFRIIQGGPYSSPCVQALIETIRQLGVSGTGQTSWGPTVFAMTDGEDQAAWLVRRLAECSIDQQLDITVTAANNQGAYLRRSIG